TFKNIRTNIVGGKLSGSIAIDSLRDPSRILLDLDYSGIDGRGLARLYPWPAQYRIDSNVTGSLHGWFEGKFERYSVAGQARLNAQKEKEPPSPAAGVGVRSNAAVPMPLAGVLTFELTPGRARVTNADIQMKSTHVLADGLIDQRASDLKVVMDS